MSSILSTKKALQVSHDYEFYDIKNPSVLDWTRY